MSWRFDLTCPLDGADVVPLTTGTSDGWSTRAIGKCTECNTELIIQVAVAAPKAAKRTTPARQAQLVKAREARSARCALS